MFYIPHGTTKDVDNNTQQFDARTYQWRVVPSNPTQFLQYTLQEKELEQEWLENNCHSNGFFKCPRCYRKHNLCDNFDLLCDGCCNILQQYHREGHSFEFTERFNLWNTNITVGQIQARVNLRTSLFECYNANQILYEGKEVVIIRDPLKNNGDLEVCYTTDDITDKKKRFIVNCFNLELN